MPTTVEVSCPKCDGPMWDNRDTKKNPKAPDYKCRDKGCDGVIWPPKPGQRSPVSQAPAKQSYTSGPHIPEMDGPVYQQETGAAPESVAPVLDTLFQMYDVCFDHAHGLAHRKLGNDASHEGIAAMAATLFIQAAKR